MKKRFLLIIAAFVLAFATAFAFVACGNDSDDSNRYTGADGTYYLWDESGEVLDEESYIVISGGRITKVVSSEMGDLIGVATVKHSGTAKRDGSITYTMKASASQLGITVKIETTMTGTVSNGIIHFTHITEQETIGDQSSEPHEGDISIYFCKQGKTPDDFGGDDPDNPDNPDNPDVPSPNPEGNTRETAIVADTDTRYNINIRNGVGNMWYAFTPDTDGTYIIQSFEYAAGGDPYCELYEGNNDSTLARDDDGGENYNFRIVRSLQEGTTYYIYAHGQGNGNISFVMTITTYPHSTREDAIDLRLGNEVNVSFEVNNQMIWYSFTPSQNGTYRFASANGYNMPAVRLYNGTSREPFYENERNNFNVSYELTAGTTYYISALSSSSSNSFDLTVTKNDGLSRENALVAGLGRENFVSITTGGQSVWFMFTPEQSGKYIFESSDCTGNPYGLLYTGNNSSADVYNDDVEDGDNNFCIIRNLTAGNVYYIEARMATVGGTGNYTFKVILPDGKTRERAISVAVDTDYDVALSAEYASVWYEFIPTRSGDYTIFSKDNTGDPQIALYNESDSDPFVTDDDGGNDTNFIVQRTLNFGAVYYLEAKGTGNYKLRVAGAPGFTRENPISVVLDQEYSVNIQSPNDGFWFEYTPTVTATYIMYSANQSGGDPYGELYGGEETERITYSDDADGRNFRIVYEMTAGTTYYIKARQLNSNTGSYTFVMKRASGNTRNEAIITVEGRINNVTISDSDGEQWFMFKPEQSGEYMIYSTDCGSSDPYCEIYSDTDSSAFEYDNDSGDGHNFVINSALPSNTIYYIRMGVRNNATGSFKLNIIRADGTSRATAYLLIANSGRDGEIETGDQSVWYRFTPDLTGVYCFNCPYDNISFRVFEENGTTPVGTKNTSETRISLTAGTTYYVEVKKINSSGSGDFSIYLVGVPGSDRTVAIEAALNAERIVTIHNEEQRVWYSFTPTVSANYTISSSNNGNVDPIANIYENGNSRNFASDDNSGANNNFEITCSLAAGTMYLIETYLSSNGDVATGTFTLTVNYARGSERSNPIAAAAGTMHNVSIGAQGVNVWFAFTPEETGSYTIMSTNLNSGDPYCTIYEGNNTSELLHQDNISSDDRNFSITREFTAGVTYYIEASMSIGNPTGSYSLLIFDESMGESSRDNPILAAVGSQYYVNIVNGGDAMWFAFTPSETGTYTILSSNKGANADPRVWLYEGNYTSVLEEDDDDGGNNNFRITRMLTAGTTYYIKAGMYNDSKTGTYTFAITRN